jgi:hypothetical protein
MATKVEILETILLSGGEITQSKLLKILGIINHHIEFLVIQNWIRRYLKVGDDLVDLKTGKLKPEEIKSGQIIIRLTESAYRFLRKYNAKSFYETPLKEFCQMHIKRPLIPRSKLAELVGSVK